MIQHIHAYIIGTRLSSRGDKGCRGDIYLFISYYGGNRITRTKLYVLRALSAGTWAAVEGRSIVTRQVLSRNSAVHLGAPQLVIDTLAICLALGA